MSLNQLLRLSLILRLNFHLKSRYESFSFRNKSGEPRNRRKTIGKLDPATGHPIYKPEYLKRMAAEGRPVENAKIEGPFTVEDIRRSTVRDYSAFYLYQELAEKMGLLAILQKAFS